MLKIVIRVPATINHPQVAQKLRDLTWQNIRSIRIQAGRNSLSGMPMSSFIPSIRNNVSNKINVQHSTSSSGSLWGSKFQLSRDSMRCRRVIGFMLGGLAASLIPEVIYGTFPDNEILTAECDNGLQCFASGYTCH